MTTQTLDYAAPPRPTQSRRGKGSLAVAATMFLPGLGQFLAGERRRGCGWFIVFAVLMTIGLIALSSARLFPVLMVLLPLSALLSLASWIDAYRVGRQSQRPMLGGPGFRYLAAMVLVGLSLFAHPSVLPALLVRQYLAEAFIMPSVAMSPTINPEDRFMCHKRGREPRRWDIIVFRAPDGPASIYAQRIVGLPGEQLEIINGKVHINGIAIPTPPGIGAYESKVRFGPGNGCQGNPIRLAADEYFLLGDNSPRSADSRYWTTAPPGHQQGTIGRADVIGRATWTYWPPSRWRSLAP